MTADDRLARIAAAPRLLVALDVDGTLAPLGDEPMAVRLLPAARRALDTLAALPDTAVALVSGRSLADLRVITELDAEARVHLAASHGAEAWHPGDPPAPGDGDDRARERDELRERAQALVADLDGAWIEPKAVGFALHTRLAGAADGVEAQRRVDELMAERAPGWRRRTGRDVLEFAYRHEGKDTAVAALRERVGATAVLFAGDDVTDEDALRSLGPADLGVHVGDGPTAAAVRVPDIESMAKLLERLARLRAARGRE